MGFWDSVKKLLGVEEDEGEEVRDVAAPGQPRRRTRSSQRSAEAGGYRDAPKQREEPRGNPYGQSPVMGYSQAEVRKRFMALGRGGITPFFHPDLIPAPDDEFTQLVDRSLVLSGLLDEEDLAEIHRIGLEWRKHRHAHEHAEILGRAAGEEAVVELKRQRVEHAQQRKAEAEQRKAERRAEVERRKREDIIHLGDGVSGKLNDRRSHVERLIAAGLPVLSTPADVAEALGVSIAQLRWLCFHDESSTVVHYQQFTIAKRSGGRRVLSAPMPHLARAQRWVLDEVLKKVPLEAPAHGFVRGRSTVTNATPHVGRDVVINRDLKDFFPSVTFPRVRGLFQQLGYSPAVATVLALLCTECPRQPIRYAGTRYHVAVGDRALPQGACTSPALANLVARKLDRRLQGICRQLGWAYTRYADDLTFSAPKGKRATIAPLLARVRNVILDEGFALNPKKGRIQRCGGRQEVTGIVVNSKPSLPRTELRRLRAILHQAKSTGLAAQNRDNIPNFRAHLEGKLAYLAMIDREKGLALLKELRALGE